MFVIIVRGRGKSFWTKWGNTTEHTHLETMFQSYLNTLCQTFHCLAKISLGS